MQHLKILRAAALYASSGKTKGITIIFIYLYWTPKLHKSPVKHHFIAGSSKCTTKELSSLLTKILTVIKTGQQKYCSIKSSHTGVNNMQILKNSTNIL